MEADPVSEMLCLKNRAMYAVKEQTDDINIPTSQTFNSIESSFVDEAAVGCMETDDLCLTLCGPNKGPTSSRYWRVQSRL
jgi:hypothetical protein